MLDKRGWGWKMCDVLVREGEERGRLIFHIQEASRKCLKLPKCRYSNNSTLFRDMRVFIPKESIENNPFLNNSHVREGERTLNHFQGLILCDSCLNGSHSSRRLLRETNPVSVEVLNPTFLSPTPNPDNPMPHYPV